MPRAQRRAERSVPVIRAARPGRSSAARAAAGERLHVRPPRPAGAHGAGSAPRGVGRAVVLRRRQQLRHEDEQHGLSRRRGM